jgi:hypothetical protein
MIKEKTLKMHLVDQQQEFSYLLAKHAIQIAENDWYVSGQTALDIVNGKITE